VGGHCIPVDPWFLLQAQDDGASLIRAARLVNDQKPRWLVGQIAKDLPEGADICVLGLAYKPDVDDLRESPGLELCRLLRERGFRVSACEPNVQAPEIQGFRNLSVEDALYGGARLVIAVGHRAFAPYRDAIASRGHYDCVGFLRQREGESC
jgi:UDP-N-acetyl-D-mannosaminuronic acid dehydrogenase